MLTRRILPCLNVIDGRVKKRLLGSERLLDVGDPVELAFKYQENGADGLVFITDSKQDSSGQELLDMIEAISQQVFMPLTVVCNVRTVAEVKKLLLAGADKVSLNSSAVADPDLISAGARLFGNQCLVTAIDVKTDPTTGQKMVYTHGGAKQVVSLGSGELLVTSMDKDGTQDGYDTAFYKELTAAVDVPVIASGGAGKIDDFADVFLNSGVTGALAASVFHFQQLTIAQVKEDLIKKGVPVRWNQTLQRGS
ncbi:imidazole glycerol phosphate synthase subunit HisF [Limosilactobacillus fermentum]|uniref:imidazole glycerol phosphate synthase subunit HisF n=1 Tax=Limosilactobacillus fermentum TaxID=1613 RepID=UPI0021A2AE57|nr:imidazole glycerol phosphate synthase cyclase subunit [Limosilactobacillus fermentum]MCT2872766.1 imidazole glycerol phosphate synthase subunit HisF [Limosilactobacillus fermentum]